MHNRATVTEIEEQFRIASHAMQSIEEIMTGRDRNPLYDPGYGIMSKPELFVAMMVKQLYGQLVQMEIYLDDYKQQVLGDGE